MPIFGNLNLVAILVAGVVSMIIGFAWYSPVMFGNMWLKLKGFSKKELENSKASMGPAYFLSFVTILVQTVILSQLFDLLRISDLSGAVQLAFMVWLGFVATTQLTMMIFSGKPISWILWIIDSSYQLASLLAITAILLMV